MTFFVARSSGHSGIYERGRAHAMGIWAETYGCDLILSASDNFYSNGPTSSAQSPGRNIHSHPAIKRVRWYATLRNQHDLDNDLGYPKIEQHWFLHIPYYSFSKHVANTSIVFIHFNSNMFLKDAEVAAEQKQFIAKILESSKWDWSVIFTHYPLFSGSPNYSASTEIYMSLFPLLLKYKVDFYISGHDIIFEHVNTHFLVSESSSSNNKYGIGSVNKLGRPSIRVQTFRSENGFLAIKLTQKLASVHYVVSHGVSVYSFTQNIQTKSYSS